VFASDKPRERVASQAPAIVDESDHLPDGDASSSRSSDASNANCLAREPLRVEAGISRAALPLGRATPSSTGAGGGPVGRVRTDAEESVGLVDVLDEPDRSLASLRSFAPVAS
jgi:hypothetical protein